MTNYYFISIWKRNASMFFVIPCFAAADDSEDPFSSSQMESSDGLIHNPVVESLLQRNRDLSFTTDSHEGVFSRPARSFITEEILQALRKADRKGRDVVVGLSNACCKWGCSKSEISSLCWVNLRHMSEQTGRHIDKYTNRHTLLFSTCHAFKTFFIELNYCELFNLFFLWIVRKGLPCVSNVYILFYGYKWTALIKQFCLVQ